MAGRKSRTKARRYAMKTKTIMLKFFTHDITREVLVFLLMLGITYFAIAGFLTLALRTDSFWMAVISQSMVHDGETWREYFTNNGYDPSEFPIQGGFERGDLLIIQGVGSVSEISVGDVIIMDMGPNVIPLVHRVAVMWEEDGNVRIMTKGDANTSILSSERSVNPERLLGKVVFVIPKIGNISLWFSGQ